MILSALFSLIHSRFNVDILMYDDMCGIKCFDFLLQSKKKNRSQKSIIMIVGNAFASINLLSLGLERHWLSLKWNWNLIRKLQYEPLISVANVNCAAKASANGQRKRIAKPQRTEWKRRMSDTKMRPFCQMLVFLLFFSWLNQTQQRTLKSLPSQRNVHNHQILWSRWFSR